MGKTKAVRDREDFTAKHETSRGLLKAAIQKANSDSEKKLPSGALSSKQDPEEGGYTKNLLDSNKLLKPPYDPAKLWSMVENSQILPQCIDAMVQNIHGFGYEFIYVGENRDSEFTPEEIKEKKDATEFLKKVNERQSFVTLSKEVREDLEKTGNGYMEIIRNVKNEITLLYNADARTIRLQKIQDEEVPVEVEFYRGGGKLTLKVYKRFRRFAMIRGKTGNKTNLVWFKEFGDPRKMNKDDGKYDPATPTNKEASELLHFKLGTDTYGIPRWSGQILVTLGMTNAEFVNYDLFANQVVPPLAIMVSGGILTSESIKDIKDILVQRKGVHNFNKVLLLESASKGTISEKDSATIELKELSQARKEDAMFTEYTTKGEGKVRSAFRLPPMILGKAESYSKSTADSSKQVAEEQVFVPERNKFDAIINTILMPEFFVETWEYKSKAPKMLRGEDITETFNNFARFGAFTINQSIRLANRLLGTDVQEYGKEVEWANYPVSIVMEYARQGVLDIGELNTVTSNIANIIGDPSKTDDPETAAKLYLALNSITNQLEKIQKVREIEDKSYEM